jgi:hypothetical protein
MAGFFMRGRMSGDGPTQVGQRIMRTKIRRALVGLIAITLLLLIGIFLLYVA